MTTFEICFPRHYLNPAHCWRDFSFPLYSFVRDQGADFENSQLVVLKRYSEGNILHKEAVTTLFPTYIVRKIPGPTHPLNREDIKIIREDKTSTTKETFFKNYLNYLPEYREFVLNKLRIPTTNPIKIFANRKSSRALILDTGNKRKIKNLVALAKGIEDIFDLVEIVQLGRLSFIEQTKKIQRANVVLGLHGAAFYQALFAHPKTVFFEIMPYGFEWDYFKVLTEAKGGKHHQYWHPDKTTNDFRLKEVANHVDVSRPFNDRTRPRLEGTYRKQTKEQWLHRYHRDAMITINVEHFKKFMVDRL